MTETHLRVVPNPFREDSADIQKSYLDGVPPFLELSLRWEQIPDLITKLRRAYNEHTGVDTTDFNQHTDIHLRPGSN